MVRVFTARFADRGQIKCRRCGHDTVFPSNGVNALLYDNGHTFVVVDATKLSLLHRCGRLYQWECRICGLLDDDDVWHPPQRGRGSFPNRPVVVCLKCGGDMLTQNLIPTATA